MLAAGQKCKCKEKSCCVTHHLTFYSDLHDTARAADQKKIDAHMARRAALPRSHFVGLGDIGDYIFHRDPRYLPSVTDPDLITTDDFLDAAIDMQVKKYSKFNWLMFGDGNHGRSILKHHGVHPAKRLARKLGTKFGGFSGFMILNFHGPRNTYAKMTVLYHHGAWGGPVIKGMGGAKRFAEGFDDWDLFCFGHNHQLHAHHETKIRPCNGKLKDRDIFIVNTGTFLKSYSQGETTYGEVKGYRPVALAAPLVKVRIDRKRKLHLSVEVGD